MRLLGRPNLFQIIQSEGRTKRIVYDIYHRYLLGSRTILLNSAFQSTLPRFVPEQKEENGM